LRDGEIAGHSGGETRVDAFGIPGVAIHGI